MQSLSNPGAVAGLARFGITAKKAYGLSTPALKQLAREIGHDHALAQQLWATEVLEGRGLAGLVDQPERVTERQMERWVRDFDSWAVCDATCLYLFRKTPFAQRKGREWSSRPQEFVKRAGFALMAYLAVHDKKAPDETFLAFLPLIEREAVDERPMVKKGVNWALRQIGKRNQRLNRAAIQVAQTMRRLNSRSARWIAADALRELQSEAVQRRLKR
jgi:3-methyladenine DNA glycosylase AlkD